MPLDLPQTLDLGPLSLAAITEADTDELLVHFGDLDVIEYLDFAPLGTREEAVEVVDWARKLAASDRGIRWVIRETSSRAFVGTCGFNSMDLKYGARAEVAYDLARSYWGRGYMRLVMPMLIDVAFRRLGLRRIQAFVTPGNERSAHVLTRHGFVHEGRLRDYGYWRDAFWDQDLFALIADDIEAEST